MASEDQGGVRDWAHPDFVRLMGYAMRSRVICDGALLCSIETETDILRYPILVANGRPPALQGRDDDRTDGEP